MEESVIFKNREGGKIFGIVHIPENSPFAGEKIGINLLNPGIKYRVAPHRLNVKLARRLCQMGYHILRFDPEGIGDSEGELPDGMLVANVWGKIQRGLFIQDAIAANDFFIKKYGLDRLILMGNCGGAITSLLASSEDPRVSALCLVDPPVYLWSSNKSFADTATEGGEKADWYFSEYVKKIVNVDSWYRFFTLRTNYRALWKTISIKFQNKFKSSPNNEGLADNLEVLCQEKKLNKLFFKSFDNFNQANKPILFVLAGNDPGFETFQNYFQNYYLRTKLEKEEINNSTEFFVVQDSNHIYALKEWQESLICKVSDWVERFGF